MTWFDFFKFFHYKNLYRLFKPKMKAPTMSQVVEVPKKMSSPRIVKTKEE